MKKRRSHASLPDLKNRDLAVYGMTHYLARLSDLALLAGSSELERQMLAGSRLLVELLESRMLEGRRGRFKGKVIDLVGRQRLRTLVAAMGMPAPDSSPPPAA